MRIFGTIEYPDPAIHDRQHLWSSLVGAIAGVSVFAVYYFFTRMDGAMPWGMPWYYYVVGSILAAFAGSSIACVLSTSIRPRPAVA